MGNDIRLGRIAGVEVSASWSLLVIAGLLTWVLAGGVLPAAAPGAPAAAFWAAGAAGSLAFLACLVAHELAHSIVARGHGMEVRGITLWMFGGVSRLTAEPPDAAAELRMALAGPLTSLALGVACVAVSASLAAAGLPAVVTATAAWLGAVNLLLAGFNLLPAFPLDGGRVLRSLVWRRGGDRDRATQVAAALGVDVGYGMIAVGLGMVLAGAAPAGVWTGLLGWIVISAARSERAAADQRARFGTVPVADVMTAGPVTVRPELTVDAFVDHVGRYRHAAFPVVDARGAPTGLAPLGRLRDVAPAARASAVVGELAVPLDQLVTARPEQALADLVVQVAASPHRCALVVDDAGRLVGIVTARDIERAAELSRIGGPDLLRRAARRGVP